jgi:quercetin dioxygenase-like cupin family protein
VDIRCHLAQHNFVSIGGRAWEKEHRSMGKAQTDLQVRLLGVDARPAGSGVAIIVCQEKLIPPGEAPDLPGTTKDIPLSEPARLALTVRVNDVPPGGRVPEHHHGGPTIDYVLSGAVRMQLLGGPALVYQAGQTMFEPSGSVHLYADNLSLTEPARIMLITVHGEGAQLNVFH